MKGCRSTFAASAFIVCLQVWACGSRAAASAIDERPQATPSPAAQPDTCAVIAATGDAITTIGLNDRIEPANAPRPTNDGERLLFRQLYETLIRVDCEGRAGPGLAAAWRFDADAGRWIVTLREDARFGDGTAVIAADVVAAWSREGSGGELRQDVRRSVLAAAAIDDRSVAITLHRQSADAPTALAHPDLAIVKRIAGLPWPLGTRSARIEPDTQQPALKNAVAMTMTASGGGPLRIVTAAGDPRDLLDAGVDLLLTRNPSALEYAGTLAQFERVPLAWQRTLVLLTPGRARPSLAPTEESRQALAADAVRGDARGAQGPFWWEGLSACAAPPSAPRAQSAPVPRVVFDASDAAARDLAERLVGLRHYQRAVGLAGDALSQARRLGGDAGYVVSVESRPLDACRDLQALLDRAPWLDPATIAPLIDTRLHAIVRRGRSGLWAEWDGGVIIANATAPRPQ